MDAGAVGAAEIEPGLADPGARSVQARGADRALDRGGERRIEPPAFGIELNPHHRAVASSTCRLPAEPVRGAAQLGVDRSKRASRMNS